MVVGCLAKLEHRIQVQKAMIKFLVDKVQSSVVQSGVPWVLRDTTESEDAKNLNKKVEVLQGDSCILSEVTELKIFLFRRSNG